MLKYIKGDLLDAPQPIIIHQVNCQGVMGSGVALAIKKRFPEAYVVYRETLDQFGDGGCLGETSSVVVSPDKKIYNLYSQRHYLPRGERHTDYEALARGFEKIKNENPEISKDVAAPKIGCGLGGGDWRIVSSMLETIFDDRDVYVYELEPKIG